jgi:hypothetical protein
MTTPYVLGQSVGDFENSPGVYLFALRRTEEGDLYLLKVNLNDPNDSAQLFGDDMPAEFADYTFPGDDYFDGRDAAKLLEFSTDDVKYEQWKWEDSIRSYYIDTEGNFVLVTGENVELPAIEDIQIPNGHAQTFDIVGENFNINLYDKLISMGWNGLSEVTVNITGDIGSTNPVKPALLITKQFKNGLTIINTGNIIGCNGNLQHDPVDNRYNGVAIVIETAVDTFTNSGLVKAGSFNGAYANVFRGFNNIDTWDNDGGTWTGYDD